MTRREYLCPAIYNINHTDGFEKEKREQEMDQKTDNSYNNNRGQHNKLKTCIFYINL